MKKYKSKFSGKSIDYAVEAVINTVGKETSNPSLDYYDNSQSGLTATTLQEAVDEISSKIDSSTVSSSAENVTYDNTTSGLTSNNVQGAIDELGANLGEYESKVDALIPVAELANVQAENVGYGNSNVKTALDNFYRLDGFDMVEKEIGVWVNYSTGKITFHNSYKTYLLDARKVSSIRAYVNCGDLNFATISYFKDSFSQENFISSVRNNSYATYKWFEGGIIPSDATIIAITNKYDTEGTPQIEYNSNIKEFIKAFNDLEVDNISSNENWSKQLKYSQDGTVELSTYGKSTIQKDDARRGVEGTFGRIFFYPNKRYKMVARITADIDSPLYISLKRKRNDSAVLSANITAHTTENSADGIYFSQKEECYIDYSCASWGIDHQSIWVDFEMMADNANCSINPFENKPYYHHINAEVPSNEVGIPSQSLADIEFAKKLGFDWIECNIHQCSDGNYVCKHGTSGKLGTGVKSNIGTTDYSNTAFSNVTSEWLRTNISLSSNISKYDGLFIPTLDEFCAKCKELGMGVKLSTTINNDTITIARKYLTDEKIWIVANVRDPRVGFRGLVEVGYDSTLSEAENIEKIEKVGFPTNLCINASEVLDADFVSALHKLGATIGVVYSTATQSIQQLKNGADVICSTFNLINPFTDGDKQVTKLNDDSLSFVGNHNYDATTETLQLANGTEMKCNPYEEGFYVGKVGLSILYSGSLDIAIGDDKQSCKLTNYQSSGMLICSVLYLEDTETNANIRYQSRQQQTQQLKILD